ncbi:MAG TPA: DUF3048 C-terminal domain-containing protein [Jatrophihabitans sp.]|nr:DUF3048 C-terminal domain-containing protein [Jatrophihabitans sp.]
MSRTRHTVIATVTATALLATAACSGGSHKAPPTTAPPTTPTTPASTPPPPPAPKNPFTGIGPVPKSPTIAVKIDDTAPGRPQRSIDLADIVYIEAVEGGLTRLAAIFGTNKPIAGYVRSTRPSDPDLLLQYGKITEAFSGGAHDSLPRVKQAGLNAWSNDAGRPFYFRVNRPESSYINLALNLAKVAKAVHTPAPKNIGWTFSPTITGLPAKPGNDMQTVVTGSYSNGTPVEFRYSSKLGKYIRYINGVQQRAADGKLVTATNVIVQECVVVSHPQDRDVLGNPSQFTFTVGNGGVAIFRQGKRINGVWSRPHLTDGTTFKSYNGHTIPLAPGNTWVVLIRKGIAVHSR